MSDTPNPRLTRASAFALLAWANSQPTRGARLLGAAESLWNEMAAEAWGGLGEDVEAAQAEIDRTGGREAAAAAWSAGAAMTVEQAIAYALEESDP